MAVTLTSSARQNTQGASVTRYTAPGDIGRLTATTESQAQVTYRTAGAVSMFYCRVVTNDRGASSLRTRINLADGLQILSIGASTTGEFQDTTNSDSIAAGDELNYSSITGAGGTTFTYGAMSILFAATSGTVKKHLVDASQVGYGTASTTAYFPIFGVRTPTTTEANQQFKWKAAGTFQNGFANITANTRSDTTTINTRINGANGATTFSIASSTTGLFEDTVNTNSIAVNDLLNWAVTLGGGTGSISQLMAVEFVPSANTAFHSGGAEDASTTINAAVTTYLPISGRMTANTTESSWQSKALATFSLSNLECYISANTVTAASTIRTRVGAANGAQSVSIGSSTTGYFEDTTNSEVVTLNNEINYQVVTGATGTSLTMETLGILVTAAGWGPLIATQRNVLVAN